MEILCARKRRDLLSAIERNAKRICGTDEAVVYVVGKNALYKTQDGQLSDALPLTGVLAEAITKNQIYDVKHASQSAHFNPVIDINTGSNIRCIPIYSVETNSVLLAIEHVNNKGYMRLDKEIMPHFVKLICTAASNFTRDGKSLVDDAESTDNANVHKSD